jgi:hypothetical protein
MTMTTTYRLTSAQRCILADCVRSAWVGWMLSDPRSGESARRWQYKATTMLGFSFSRFATAAMNELGPFFTAKSPASDAYFPLTIREVVTLASMVELEMATDISLHSAGIIAAHSPFGQPEVCGRDWRTFTSMLSALGLSIDDDRPNWREEVRHELRFFAMDVSAAAAEAAE